MLIRDAIFQFALDRGFRLVSRPAFFHSEYYAVWFDAINEPFSWTVSPEDEEFTDLTEEFAEINQSPPAGLSGCLELTDRSDSSGRVLGFALYTEQRFIPSGQGSLVNSDSAPAQRADAMPVLFINRIATRKEIQGRGGGKLLMTCLFDLARTHGIPDVMLESRVSSESFYQHIGMNFFYDYMIKPVLCTRDMILLTPLPIHGSTSAEATVRVKAIPYQLNES
ncbi:GNAT family N-acetyltransferase [Spongorhabdus nitratireducens]